MVESTRSSPNRQNVDLGMNIRNGLFCQDDRYFSIKELTDEQCFQLAGIRPESEDGRQEFLRAIRHDPDAPMQIIKWHCI